MIDNTTIAAISTAQGSGGIAVIRISGDKAIEIADRVFVPISGKRLSQLNGYSAAYGHIYSKDQKIDEAVATVFRAPHSYTGENVVELSCHGGVFLTAQVLRVVLDSGAVPAEAGEFTKRAFLNGKTDLTGAEAVMELIGAKSKAAARAALSLREGALSKKISHINEKLLNAAAHLSAWADYPEEDIAEVDPEEMSKNFTQAEKELEELLNSYDSGQAVIEGIDTVIAGRPNVGKSTLMNLLAGREKSIVTEIAGTTRDIIEETVVLGNIILKLSDTAGLRETDNAVEKIGVELTRKRLETCGLVLAVFDISEPLQQEDLDLLELIRDIPFVAVVNKTDLPPKADTKIIRKYTKNCVEISAKDSKCLEKITQIINEIAGAQDFDPSQAILSNERQRRAAADALLSLKEASAALRGGMTYDAVTVSLEYAIDSLLTLTGEKASDAIIDKVFHNFCVGK